VQLFGVLAEPGTGLVCSHGGELLSQDRERDLARAHRGVDVARPEVRVLVWAQTGGVESGFVLGGRGRFELQGAPHPLHEPGNLGRVLLLDLHLDPREARRLLVVVEPYLRVV
jgi:hypothetical protein